MNTKYCIITVYLLEKENDSYFSFDDSSLMDFGISKSFCREKQLKQFFKNNGIQYDINMSIDQNLDVLVSKKIIVSYEKKYVYETLTQYKTLEGKSDIKC